MHQLNGIDSKFRLVLLAAKRAKQLIRGSRKKVDIKAENPLTIALEELHQGKINFAVIEQEEMTSSERNLNELAEEEAKTIQSDPDETEISTINSIND